MRGPGKLLRAVRTGVLAFALLTIAGVFPAQAAKPPIRVGMSIAQTGEFEDLARSFHRGIEFWVRDINSRGALLGRPIELVVYDDESSAERAAELYERLITEDRVDLLIGPFSSTLALAAAAVAERHGFPMVVEATAPVVYEQGFRNVFGIYTPASENMNDVLSIAQERGLSSIAIAYQSAEFPRAVAAGARVKAPGHGMNVVFDEGYPVGARDLSDFVERLAATRPELIVVGAYVEDAVLFVRALKQSRYAPKMIAISGAPASAAFGEALGGDTQGVIATTQWMRDGRIPLSFDFGFRFRERYGRYPSYNAAGGYAAGQILEAATRLAGSTDRAAVREQLGSMRFESLLGQYRVDATGRQVGTQIFGVQWQGTHRSLVFPEEISRWELLFPFPPWESR